VRLSGTGILSGMGQALDKSPTLCYTVISERIEVGFSELPATQGSRPVGSSLESTAMRRSG
jgi:hypothetical protein